MESRPIRTRVDQQGRVVIPAEHRKALGIQPGDVVAAYVEDGEFRVLTVEEGARRAQAIVAKYGTPGSSLVDELIAERRAEAERE